MSSVGQSVHRFRGFEVHPLQRQLRVAGQSVDIGARAFDVLLALVARRGDLVTKGELLDTVWAGRIVEENNLVVQIGTLRKLLGADVVATIPGRGYRLTALPVEDGEAAAAAAAGSQPTGAKSADAMRTNLPEVLAPLIGREDDLAALQVLLAEHRLVTITGAGGMGKTRLAEWALHERRSRFAQGVVWVELAGLAEPGLVAATIAGALDLQIGAGDPLRGLVAALKPLQMLVALDNAEHLVDEVARVASAALAGAPQLHWLVTSQVPLRLSAERVYRLGALAVPDAQVPFAEALAHGAVALFVERARCAGHRFEADELTLPHIVRLCAQLDGVALAIELAAARVPALGVAAVADSLDERLRLLTQNRRGAPERQRTLRDALAWSHSLLNEAEATVFRRLAVFAGGFSLAMARDVVADPPVASGVLDAWAVVDALGALVDRSFVAADEAMVPRYRLLESARVFALEHLAAAGEMPVLRRRHAAAVSARFAEVEAAQWAGRMSVDDALAEVEPDLDNARAALVTLLAEDDIAGVAALAPALSFALTSVRHAERSRLWEQTAPLIEGIEAGADGAVSPGVLAAWAVGCSGHWYQLKPAPAQRWARIAIDIYRRANDTPRLYRALGMLGLASPVADCAAAYEAMRALEKPDWPARLRFLGAQVGYVLGMMRGDLDAQRAELLRVRRLAVAAGYSHGLRIVDSALADFEFSNGRPDEAVRIGLDLERRHRDGRDRMTLAYVRVNLVGALLAVDAFAQARAMAVAAWPMAVSFEIDHALADSLALLAAREARPRAAALLLGYADSRYAVRTTARQPNEALAAGRAARIASEALGAAAFERERTEGGALHEDMVLALALADDDAA